MSKFRVYYKLALAVLVLPTLVFFYLVGMSAFNNNAVSNANMETEIIIPPRNCGTLTYEKSDSFNDTVVNIDYSSNKKSISVNGLNNWNVVKVWLCLLYTSRCV